MKRLLFILTFVFLIACSAEQTTEIESDIFISTFDNKFDAEGKSILKDSTQAIRFSKDFWNYFIRTHPRASAMLFILPLYDSSNNYVSLPDTSYSFYNGNSMSPFYFNGLLADSVNGQKNSEDYGSFIVMPEDKTGATEQDKRIEQRLKDYTITPTVRKEFDHLKSILSIKDTSRHYVIVFKKRFADKIYQLYE